MSNISYTCFISVKTWPSGDYSYKGRDFIPKALKRSSLVDEEGNSVSCHNTIDNDYILGGDHKTAKDNGSSTNDRPDEVGNDEWPFNNNFSVNSINVTDNDLINGSPTHDLGNDTIDTHAQGIIIPPLL
ncbi:hypothetical protein NDU88_001818 [Pleurodeles waltl]|uniref:Uncharacterized protein n=1 Tax=Pleurodeles waltl TaxID=8319 RepID=A0AAV7T0P2_PLEWA|nr:hypothetical protein NDU88_001818 [Pleurodeles waltl]